MHTFHKKIPSLLLITIYLIGSVAMSAETIETKENTTVALADEVLRDILTIPERSIPPALLAQVQAIAIIPGVIKIGLVLGGSYGEGVILMKNRHTRTWSDPVFLTLKGGSLGLQMGAQSSDLILVFKNKRGLTDLMHGELTLGAGASVAAGPVGRSALAATDVKLRSEIMSYSRSRGLFAGISLEGASLGINNAANAAFYNRNEISPRQIFNGEVRSPRAVQTLKNSLREHAGQ